MLYALLIAIDFRERYAVLTCRHSFESKPCARGRVIKINSVESQFAALLNQVKRHKIATTEFLHIFACHEF